MRQECGSQESDSQASIAVEEAPQTPTAVPRGASARLGYVDGLRALAALYVMVGHMVFELWPDVRLPPGLATIIASPFIYGHFAVSVFITLSGFSLMLPVARNNNRIPWGVWGFYVRRARRILPPYYFAMGLSLLLIWLVIGHKTNTVWDTVLPVTQQALWEHLLLLQDLSRVNAGAINYAFWSIAMELQIYLFFPALVVLWRRYPPLFAMSLMTLLSLLLFIALVPTWIGQTPAYATAAFAPQYFGLFAMGMFAASAHTAMNTPWAAQPWSAWACWRVWDALGAGGFALLALTAGSAPFILPDLVTGVMTVGLLLAASYRGHANPIRAALEWRPLVWIGGFSYSLYLIHAPLIQLLWQYALRPLALSATATYLLLLALGGPLIVAASWLFWYGCERPFLNSRPIVISGDATMEVRRRMR